MTDEELSTQIDGLDAKLRAQFDEARSNWRVCKEMESKFHYPEGRTVTVRVDELSLDVPCDSVQGKIVKEFVEAMRVAYAGGMAVAIMQKRRIK